MSLVRDIWDLYKDVREHANFRKRVHAKLDWLMATRHDDFKDVHRKLEELAAHINRLAGDTGLDVVSANEEWMYRVITKLDAIQGALLLKDFENHQTSGGKSKTRRTVPVNLTPSRPRKLQVTK